MKKIIKYLLVLIFIVPAAFMFFACGETDNGGGNNPGGGTPSNLGTLYGIYVQYGDEEKSQNYCFSTSFEYGADISEVYDYKIIANYRKNPNLEIDKNNPDLTIEYFMKSYSDGGEVRTPIQTIPETPDVGSYLIVITFGQQTAEISFYVEQNPSVDPNYTFVVKSAGETDDNTYAYNTEDNVVISVKDANNQNIENDNYGSVYYLTEEQYEEYSQCEDTFVAKQEYLSNLMSGNNINNWVSVDENQKVITSSLDVGTYYFFTYVYSMGNYSSSYTNPVRVVVKKGTITVSTVGDFVLKGEFDVWNNYNSETWDSENVTLADVIISTIDYTQDDNPGLYFRETPLSYFGSYVFSSPETKIKGVGNNPQSVDFVLNEEYQNNYNTLPSIQIPVVINKYAISRPCVYGTYEDIDYETTYNGSEINFTEQLQYYSNTLSSITNATKTNAGTYTSVISIKEPEFFEWDNRYLSEGYNYGEFNTTNNTASFVWKINKAQQDRYSMRMVVKNANGEIEQTVNAYTGDTTNWYNDNGGMNIEITYTDGANLPASTTWYWAVPAEYTGEGTSTGLATILNSQTTGRQNKVNVTICGTIMVYLANDGDDNFEPFGDKENLINDSIGFQLFINKADLPNATEIQAQLDSYPATVQLSADNNDQFTVPASMFPTNNYSTQGSWVLKDVYGNIKNAGDAVDSSPCAGETFSWTLNFVPTNTDVYETLYKEFVLELIYKDLPIAGQINQELETITQTTHKLYYAPYNGDDCTITIPSSVFPETDYSSYGTWHLQDQNDHYWSNGVYDYDKQIVTGAGQWKLTFQPKKAGVYAAIVVTVNVIVQVPFNEDVTDDLTDYLVGDYVQYYRYTLKIVNNKITIPAELIPTNTHTESGEWKLYDKDGNEVTVGDKLERTTAAYENDWHFTFIPTDTNYANCNYYITIKVQSDIPVDVAQDLSYLYNGSEYTYSLVIDDGKVVVPAALFPNNTYYNYGHWELYDNNDERVYANTQLNRTTVGHEDWTYKFVPDNELYDTFEATIDIVIQNYYNIKIVIDDLDGYKNEYDNCVYNVYLENNSNTATIPAALIPQTTHTTEGHWELYDNLGNKRSANDEIEIDPVGSSYTWTFTFVPANELYAEVSVLVYVGFYYTIPNSYYTDINAVINDETARTIQLQGTDEIEVPNIVPSTAYTEGKWTLYTDKNVKVIGGRGLSGYAEGEYTWKYVFEFNTTGNYNLTYYAEPVEITIIVVANN